MWMGWTWSIQWVFTLLVLSFIAFSYTHFVSLDPLLHRSALTSTFIDIWNSIDRTSFLYHSSRASCRTSFIVIVTTTVWWTHTSLVATSSALSFPLPLAVQSICHGISIHHICYQRSWNTSHCYASKSSLWLEVLATQEAGPRCGKLKLRDWLCRLGQRLPGLIAVHTLVSKNKRFTFSTYTLSKYVSAYTCADTFFVSSTERATPSLPLKLVSPGRTLL